MDTAMDEILAKTEELGRLIKNTEIYRNFIHVSELLHSDSDAMKILDEYARFSKEIKERQDSGDIVEKFEIEHAKNLGDTISENEAIMKYLNAQKEYLGLLRKIQEELGDSE
jgi:cell fate (sporulation/competence/biofilm development) regulator YlbF (YheA/YmcA/DUF963 family)